MRVETAKCVKTTKHESKRQNASQNVKTRVEMAKRESKWQNVSRNGKKGESKRQNASRNVRILCFHEDLDMIKPLQAKKALIFFVKTSKLSLFDQK